MVVSTIPEYNAQQLTGTPCGPKNCAAASDADAIYYGTGGKVRLTADDVRRQANVSCIPGVHSPSGGLFISDVQRVASRHGVTVDYGRDPVTYYERWPASEAQRLVGAWGAIFQGWYGSLPRMYRAPGSTFTRSHSAWAHDYRTKQVPFGGGQPVQTVCWHDPLRKAAILLPLSALLAYWQDPSSPVRGFAGFVRLPAVVPKPVPHWAANIAADIQAKYGSEQVAKKLRALGITSYGDALNYSDLEAGLRKRRINFGTSVQLRDVDALMKPGTGP